MNLSELPQFVRAAYSGIYVTTNEIDECVQEIGIMCQAESWRAHVWDDISGMNGDETSTDPESMVSSLMNLCEKDKETIVILKRFQYYMKSPIMISVMTRALMQGKQCGLHIVVVAPDVNLPVELSRLFVVLEHALPNRQQIERIIRATAQPDELPSGDEFEQLLDAATGLTRSQVENAASLSIVRHQRVDSREVFKVKAQEIDASGILKFLSGPERFTDLGGLENIKGFLLRALDSSTNRKSKPRGVVLLGVPGTGKSVVSRALGNEVGLPTIALEVGALMGSLVGETERKTREAIRIINAMGRVIVQVEEVEKAFSGTSGANDSGVSSRMMGSFLTWLSDPDKQAFVIASANDIKNLPSAFTRSGRFNAVFFHDLPSREQKDTIWRIYLDRFGITENPPDDVEWTGADIEACVETADLLGISLADASQYVTPVARTASEEIERLRVFAHGRCIDANSSGIYSRTPAQTAPVASQARRINRG